MSDDEKSHLMYPRGTCFGKPPSLNYRFLVPDEFEEIFKHCISHPKFAYVILPVRRSEISTAVLIDGLHLFKRGFDAYQASAG